MNKVQAKQAYLEHSNITVRNPDKLAALLCKIFGWQVRWSGASMDNGRTVHVGLADDGKSYLALYSNSKLASDQRRDHNQLNNLNHLGIVVDDLNATEERVVANGLTPFNYGEYEPGRRFYFHADDDLEIEVINYAN